MTVGALSTLTLTFVGLVINFHLTETAASQWIGDDGAMLLLPVMAAFGALLGLVVVEKRTSNH
jgi:hypothetical protein